MFIFSSENREYSSWTAIDNHTGKSLKSENLQPIKNKLFNFDRFSFDGDKVIIDNSPTRTGSIAGVLIIEGNKTFGKRKHKFLYKFVPDDKRLPVFLVAYKIKHGFSKSYKNRYAIVYFKKWDSKHPEGYIDQNIGPVDDLPCFYQYQLYCRSLNASIQNFTKSALKKLKDKPESDLVNLIIEKYKVIDRRNLNIVTIDPMNSKDFDDGFGVEQDGNGYILSVYIANVPMWIDFLGLWDSFSNRIATIYLPDRKLPMLPTILSDVLCSLQEGCSRFALSLDIHIDINYNITSYKLVNTVIKVTNNLRYDTNDMNNNSLYKQAFKIVKALSRKKMYIDNIKSSHSFIAYLMIMMNHYCATVLFDNNIGIYRTMSYSIAEKPQVVEDNEISNFIKGWNSSGGQYCKISDCISHDALNLEKYIHITSPIRRLVDLLNIIDIQLVLKLANFTHKAITFHTYWTTNTQIAHINSTMRSIRKVQNDCNLLYMCTNQSEILCKKHRGFIFDKMKRSDGIFQYQVYLTHLKIAKKTFSSIDVSNNNYYNFELYLFRDQIQLYQKVRLLLKIE